MRQVFNDGLSGDTKTPTIMALHLLTVTSTHACCNVDSLIKWENMSYGSTPVELAHVSQWTQLINMMSTVQIIHTLKIMLEVSFYLNIFNASNMCKMIRKLLLMNLGSFPVNSARGMQPVFRISLNNSLDKT